MRKIKVLNKQIPIVAIAALVMMAGIGSAAVISYYGQVTTSLNVGQSVVLDNMQYPTGVTETLNPIAGDVICSEPAHILANRASVPAEIQFTTTSGSNLEGIVTSYESELSLTSKNVVFGSSPWVVNGDKTATIRYTLTGNEFKYQIIALHGFDPAGYTLIYYKDYEDRFNHPAEAIKITPEIGSIPQAEDANLGSYSYCTGGSTGETYNHCHGAKLWLVPNESLTGTTIDWSKASDFLFETDLISYTDSPTNEMTLPETSTLPLKICHTIAVNVWPGEYSLLTQVLPVV